MKLETMKGHLRTGWPFPVLLGLLFVAVFWVPLSSPEVLFPPVDSPPFFKANHRMLMLRGNVGPWVGDSLGFAGEPPALYPARILEVMLPPLVYHATLYAGHIALLALAGLYLVRGYGISGLASWLAALAMGFSGYAFSLISAGHREMFIMMPYAVFMLATLYRGMARNSVFHFAWAGACAAFGIVAQPDVMGMFGILAAAYGLFLLVRKWNHDALGRRALVKNLIWGGILAVSVFGAIALSGKVFLTRAVEHRESVRGEAPQQKWIFATNWSMPPEEMVEFFVPCIFGIETGDPRGPYWGRLGRTFEWERHRQGLRNFRQHTVYLGVIQLVFAMYGVVWAIRRRGSRVEGRGFEQEDAEQPPSQGFGAPGKVAKEAKEGRQTAEGEERRGSRLRRAYGGQDAGQAGFGGEGSAAGSGPDVDSEESLRERRKHVFFWAIVAVVGVFLALGRYFLLYRFFYMLPFLSKFRCPVKFIHLVEVAVCVLFAFGVAAFLDDLRSIVAAKREVRSAKEKNAHRTGSIPWSLGGVIIAFGSACAVAALVMFAAAGLVESNSNNLYAYWRGLGADLDGSLKIMLGTMTGALTHAGLVFAVVAGVFLAGRFFWSYNGLERVLGGVLALVLCVDLASVGRKYVRVGDVRPWYSENPAAEKILADEPSRVWFQLDARGLTWRYWLCGNFLHHGVALFPYNEDFLPWPEDYRKFFGALDRDVIRLWMVSNCRYILGPTQTLAPLVARPSFEVVMYFDAESGRIKPTAGKGQNVLLRDRDALPKALLYHAWDQVTLEQALATIPKANWDPWKTALVSDGIPSRRSDRRGSKATIVKYRQNHVEIAIEAPEEGVLLLNDRYDAGWDVRVDGEKKPLLRCNYIMRGVQVPAGKHTVVFTYRPYLIPFLVSIGTCVVLIVWSGGRGIAGRRRKS